MSNSASLFMRWAVVGMSLLLSAAASPEAKRQKLPDLLNRTVPIPYLPKCPLRYENIGDDEVREIQKLTATRSTNSVVNIGGVVADCTCEEAAACVEQVAVVAYFNGRTERYVLAKSEGHWDWSRLQQWWFDYEAQNKNCNNFSGSLSEIRAQREQCWAERDKLYLRTPRCPVNPDRSAENRQGDARCTGGDYYRAVENGERTSIWRDK